MPSDEKYIHDLISQGEHQQLDFKFEITSARKIAKTLVAFANTEGGRLLIGVKDNGRITGVRSDEEYYMIESAAKLYCRPEISFESVQRMAEGKTVLEIYVPASPEKPHYASDEEKKWLAYHRVLDENMLANPILLQVWKREKSPRGTFIKYSEHETQLLTFLKQHEEATFSEIKRQLALKNAIIKNILVNLVSLKVVKMAFRENEVYYAHAEEVES